eukprot:TRINITY_DN3868_c0_g1_i6.p1 TRINITY_DN3868_c0_g1~~TRINITY_DN3868_c0_g1_i6.p1  ORF type:complete len:804 (-),score=199.43 TRINITY_DN3868_c0_g1_i6:79-2490(-)
MDLIAPHINPAAGSSTRLSDTIAPPEKSRKLEDGSSTRSSGDEELSTEPLEQQEPPEPAAPEEQPSSEPRDNGSNNSISQPLQDVQLDSEETQIPEDTEPDCESPELDDGGTSSLLAEVNVLMDEMDKDPIIVGAHYYLVCSKWWKQWQSLDEDGPGPGPIDNSELLLKPCKQVVVKRELREGQHYKLLPSDVWTLLHDKFGGGPEIRRIGLKEAYSCVKVEVHLRKFDVFRSSDLLGPSEDVYLSQQATIQEATGVCAAALDLEVEDVRMWDYFQKSKYGLLDEPLATVEGVNLQDNQDLLLEERDLDGTFPESVSEDTTAWDAWDSTYNNPYTTSSPTQHTYSDTISTRGPLQRGVCGLQNLGNTCFMNSGLSCLLNVPHLVQCFAQPNFESLINERSVLGSQGEMARSFGALTQLVWMTDAAVVAPRSFKQTMGKLKPDFKGFDQQCSADLMNSLLDLLHEDLNQISNPPPTEKVEISAEMPDPKQVAAEAWRRHKLRNDSVIVDNLVGQYKSTIVCPRCNKVSVTFDPYMSLTVPLAAEESKTLSLTLMLQDHTSHELQICVKNQDTVAEALSTLCEKIESDKLAAGVVPQSLLFTEVWSNKIFKTFRPREELCDISESDRIVVYQVSNEAVFQPRLQSSLTTAASTIGVAARHNKPLNSPRDPTLFEMEHGGSNAQFHQALRASLGLDQNYPLLKVQHVEPYAYNRPASKDIPDDDEQFDTKHERVVNVMVLWDEPPVLVRCCGAAAENDGGDSGGAKTLYDCLALAAQPELLTGENEFYCGQCKDHVEATKQLDVAE